MLVHSHTLIENQITKVIFTPRQDTLQPKPKVKLNCILLIKSFNNPLPPLAQII